MSLHHTLGLVAMVSAAWAGCADDKPATDAGPDGALDGGDDGGGSSAVTPPDIPWLAAGMPPIMLAPCPPGWREVHGGDVVECDPYPEGGAASCDAGEAHFPGEPGCRPIGDPCPAGDYATSVPSGGPVVYVDASAPAGGDGSLAAPFATLSDVPWASLAAPLTIAVGKGSYGGVLPLKAGMVVVGACTRETVLTGIAAPVPSVVSVTNRGDGAAVRNLTIRGAPQHGVIALANRSVSLEGVLIEGARGLGVFADGVGAEVSLTDVVVRGTEASAGDPLKAGGMWLQRGARVEGTRLIVESNRTVGIAVHDEGAISLADCVVRDTRPREVDLLLGRGINVERGGRADVVRSLFLGNRQLGVYVAHVGSTVTLTDVVVRDTFSRAADGEGGGGVAAEAGGEVTATRLLVANNRDVGVFIEGPGSRAVLTHAVIRNTEPQANGEQEGHGLVVQLAGQCEATQLLVSDSVELALFVLEGSAMSITDAVIQRTASAVATGTQGMGISVQSGARLDGSRLLVRESRAMGLFATDEGTVVELADMVIRDSRSDTGDLGFGRGLQAQLGARLDGVRLEVERSTQLGIMAVADATVVLLDTSVRTVEISDCASTTCLGSEFGYGVGTYSASLALTRFEVAAAAICGVMIAPHAGAVSASSLDLEAGVVSGAEIGACVQVDGYDLNRLTNGVEYRDNATNLDSTMLPVPGVVD